VDDARVVQQVGTSLGQSQALPEAAVLRQLAALTAAAKRSKGAEQLRNQRVPQLLLEQLRGSSSDTVKGNISTTVTKLCESAPALKSDFVRHGAPKRMWELARGTLVGLEHVCALLAAQTSSVCRHSGRHITEAVTCPQMPRWT